MKLSENWLRTLCDPGLSTAELAHRLTMSGIEIEAIEAVAPQFSGVVVAKVLSVDKHPNADRLNLCRVDVGSAEPLQIVCGAPNVAAGMKVPCAKAGAELPGISIREAKVRGVESFGMLCSAKELGLAEESSGLLVLPEDAPVGQDFRAYRDLDDRILDLKLTPNRADCLSVLGVAREISATTQAKLDFAEIAPAAVAGGKTLAIQLDAREACPLYCGRLVEGVDASAPTPEWMVRRLERSGIRPKNAIVDVTNYVLLEMGQPMHAFDAARISGGIRVRFAAKNEKILLLNDEEVEAAEDMLFIADNEKPLALAGIMGGKESAVSGESRNIFLESAFFSPEIISGKSRILGFGSDSSYRFERGVDFGSTAAALERATQLILEICGGVACPVSEARATLPARNPILLRISRAKAVLGIELDAARVRELLARLGLELRECAEGFFVTPPAHRFDLALEVDLIEELARLHGYDDIPAVLPQSAMEMLPRPETTRSLRQLRQLLADRGYNETLGYAFVDSQWEADFCANSDPILLMNPIAAQMSAMRSSLVGNLIETLRFNLNRKLPRVRIFEAGSCFFRDGEGFSEKEMLAGLCYGEVIPEQWGEAARNVDFYDLKGDLEALFSPYELSFEKFQHPALHPGRSAQIYLRGRKVGFLGELHPKWFGKYDLARAPVLFEIEADAALARDIPAYAEVSRFPPVRRDLSLVVAEAVAAGEMLAHFREILPQSARVELFDLYRGRGLEEGKKSLAFKIVLQDTQKTLLDSEVDAIIAQLIEAAAKRFDSKLRL